MKAVHIAIVFSVRIILGKEVGVCHKSENGIRIKECCVDYYYNATSNECQECSSGFIGEKCKDKCIGGYYGKLCRHECHCSDTERCDHVYGCGNTTLKVTTTFVQSTAETETSQGLQITTVSEKEKEGDREQSNFSTVYLLIVGLLLISVLMALCFRYRCDKCFSYKKLKITNPENIAPPPIATATVGPIGIDIEVEDSEEEMYCDIRESLMIDNFIRPVTGLTPVDRRHNSRLTKVSTLRENMYNHLNYKGSLPNVCVANKYSSVMDTGFYKAKRQYRSENCLIDSNSSKMFYSLQNVQEIQEDDTTHGEVWQGGNDDTTLH